jgi:uncharacterized protein
VAVRRPYHSVVTEAVVWTWDPVKDKRNRTKHGLSLADGVPALADPFSATRLDPYAHDERWQTVGRIGPLALLVIHTDPETQPDGRSIGHIISVRRATRREREAFEEGTF